MPGSHSGSDSGSRFREIALLALVSVVLFVGVGELAVRVYLSRNTFYDVEMSRYSQLLKADSPNPRIGHVHHPNSEAVLMDAHVRINSAGFRDDEMALERSERRRMIFLGDSLTFGWGVEKEQTFEHRLEQALDAQHPTEILNFAAGNYNTTQQVEVFFEKGPAYRPDDVVVFYFINDAEPMPVKSRYEWLGASRLISFYWSRAKALIGRLSPSAGFQAYYRDLYRDDQPGWISTRDSFRRLAEYCQRERIRLRVVILPELHELVDYPFTREHGLVNEHVASLGVPVLDLAPRFGQVTEPQALWVALDDAHPNAKAHALIAEYSLPFLMEAPNS